MYIVRFLCHVAVACTRIPDDACLAVKKKKSPRKEQIKILKEMTKTKPKMFFVLSFYNKWSI